jgi:hypothetical protein
MIRVFGVNYILPKVWGNIFSGASEVLLGRDRVYQLKAENK